MGYYIRLLSASEQVPALDLLARAVSDKPGVVLSREDAGGGDWREALLAHGDGTAIASIERNAVEPGQLGSDEIKEFLAEIDSCKPASAVAWLRDYLATVRNIYAFQVLSGADEDGGWQAIRAVKSAAMEAVGGIPQADREGFSNEEGFHILWQFSDRVRGPWWMAVLRDGAWVTFQMDLGDRNHRAAFRRGEVPDGVTPQRPPT